MKRQLPARNFLIPAGGAARQGGWSDDPAPTGSRHGGGQGAEAGHARAAVREPWRRGGGRRFGLGEVPPRNGSLCTTAPGAGCLGFSAENPLSDQSLVPISSRPSLRLFRRLVRFSASVDHQMTSAWLMPLFGLRPRAAFAGGPTARAPCGRARPLRLTRVRTAGAQCAGYVAG